MKKEYTYDEETKKLIKEIRKRIKQMTAEKRCEVSSILFEGYCTECCVKLKKNYPCYCTCDD